MMGTVEANVVKLTQDEVNRVIEALRRTLPEGDSPTFHHVQVLLEWATQVKSEHHLLQLAMNTPLVAIEIKDDTVTFVVQAPVDQVM